MNPDARRGFGGTVRGLPVSPPVGHDHNPFVDPGQSGPGAGTALEGMEAVPGPRPKAAWLRIGARMDKMRIMAVLQIRSVRKPLDTPRLAREAIATLTHADAMGLLPDDQRIEELDLPLLQQVVDRLRRARIGRAITLTVGADGRQAAHLERALGQLNAALEESPVPQFEWRRLADVLGLDQLARLLGISPSSIRRYRSAARTTPDDVAARLHFIALVVGDLGGAYNDLGIRQWFERKRAQLGGRAPAELLTGEWSVVAPGPTRVRALAQALTASPAT